MSLEEAWKHCSLAAKQLERAQVDSWDPEEPASCVTNAFYAYENLVVAVAEAKNLPWLKNHFKKAELARELANQKVLSLDLHDEMLRLNELRKNVSYGEPGEELLAANLEDLVSNLESVVEEVELIISGLEEKSEADED